MAVTDRTAISGTVIVFTGTLQRMGRDSAKALAREHGAKVAGSLSTQTDYLVVGDEPGGKVELGHELGIQVISEDAFFALFGVE